MIAKATVYLFLLLPLTLFATPPNIQLATSFRQDININQYFVSEKLDGLRAYWNGQNLISRQGNTFFAPAWFTENFPATALDGELWIDRNKFELVSSIVRTKHPDNPDWQQVKFMIFDLPKSPLPFKKRIKEMQKIVETSASTYLQMIPQQKLTSHQQLQQLLEETIKQQGEGLMLHHQDALYQHKRSAHLMKLKKFEDAEAIVIAHLPRQGKYKGKMGAILVENSEGIRFKIGSGFSDQERENPPAIGSTITYRYTGKTKNNVPRFASFIRVRVIY